MTNRTMYLYHITHKSEWYSIGVQGLLTMYSTRRREKIGLVTGNGIRWALSHCAVKMKCSVSDLIIVKVRVRRSTIRRNHNRGVWYSTQDIYPCRIESIEAAK